MPMPGPLELVIILVIALLVLGPGKLPEVGSALGKSIREFRKAATDVQDATRLDAPQRSPETSTGTATTSQATPAAPPPAPGDPSTDPKS